MLALSNIPIRVPTHFMGREEALAAIEAGLGRYQGRVAITALHGLRGVGKTVLSATVSFEPLRTLDGSCVPPVPSQARRVRRPQVHRGG